MKKIMFLSIIVLLVLVTGCGDKKLICQYSSTNSYYGSDNVFSKTLFDKKGKMTKYIINEKMSYNDQYLEDSGLTMDALYEQYKDYCSSLPESKNVECSFSKNGNTLTANVEYNISKMTEKEIEDLSLTSYVSLTEDEIKTQYKSQGFTCK